ncbi:MAG: hypothetical protein JNL58_13420 [Planctomyces sp.]|nr:hypothetical protein [Planctomyces sp.]
MEKSDQLASECRYDFFVVIIKTAISISLYFSQYYLIVDRIVISQHQVYAMPVYAPLSLWKLNSTFAWYCEACLETVFQTAYEIDASLIRQKYWQVRSAER